MPRDLAASSFGFDFRRSRAVAGEIVDLGLVRLQVGDIVLQRALLSGGRREARQRQQLLAALEILVDAFLDHRAEGVPDLGEGLGILLAQRLQLADHAGRHGLPDLRELRIVLQHLPGEVQRQILGIDDAADETQIGRQQVRIVGDEDAPHIEGRVALAVRLEQVERLLRFRREQQHRVGVATLGTVMQRHRRFVIGMGDRLVSRAVVLRRQLGLGALPQRACRIDLARLGIAVLEHDPEAGCCRIGADNALDLVSFEIFLRVVFQLQLDRRAGRHAHAVI